MSEYKHIAINDLLLDQHNPRIVACASQHECLEQIYACNKSGFIKLINSIIKKGFLKGECIIVQPSLENPKKYIVKEGNRRVSALKLLHGAKSVITKSTDPKLLNYQKKFPAEVAKNSRKILCLVFGLNEVDEMDAEIEVRHMSDSAGKDDWPSVRKARYVRDKYDSNVPWLELLERYFIQHEGTDEMWSPTFPLTILQDFMADLSTFLGYKDSWALANSYPDSATKATVDDFIEEIYMPKRIEDIRKLDNRRYSNGLEFISKFYTKPVNQIDSTPKPSPITTQKPLPPPPPSLQPRPQRRHPIIARAKKKQLKLFT